MSEIDTTELDYVVIGGGVVGLLTAHEILTHFSHLNGALVEAETFLAEHSSSRNSGVLHAGLYYPTSSLKHQACLQGRELWNTLAEKLEIPILKCGKYIISTAKSEESALKELFHHASHQNQVPHLRWVSDKEKTNLREFLHIENGFFSPNTAILDVTQAIRNLESDLFKKGLPVLKESKAKKIKRKGKGFEISLGSDLIYTKNLINCAGLWSVDVRGQLGLENFKNFWVKGHYMKYHADFYSQSLLYPLPEKNLKGLGVHTSFSMDRIIRFGPDTLDTSKIEYSFDTFEQEKIISSILKVFKGINPDFLALDYSGIRAKILDENGSLYPDFWYGHPKNHFIPHYYEFCGIDSPGLTASPALAKILTQDLSQENNWSYTHRSLNFR